MVCLPDLSAVAKEEVPVALTRLQGLRTTHRHTKGMNA